MRNLSLKIIILFSLLLAFGCTPKDMKKATEKYRWPLPPNAPRIEFVRFWNGEQDFDARSGFKEMLLGKEQSRMITKLEKPYGVAVDSKGNVYVCDTIIGRVFVFDVVQKRLHYLGLEGPSALRKPIGITVTSDDNVWVADAERKVVIRYAPDGSAVGFFGEVGELTNPTSVAVDEAIGILYVADSKAHKINVYDVRNNSLVRTFGERGFGTGQFNYPTNLTVDKEGYLYVVDSLNFRVQIFDRDGNFDSVFGSPGNEPGTLARPRGIAVDREGNIFIADALHNSVQLFNADFELLMWLGGYQGIDPGEFIQPSGLWINSDGKLYVSDSLNHRVQVFQLLYLSGANTPGETEK